MFGKYARPGSFRCRSKPIFDRFGVRITAEKGAYPESLACRSCVVDLASMRETT